MNRHPTHQALSGTERPFVACCSLLAVVIAAALAAGVYLGVADLDFDGVGWSRDPAQEPASVDDRLVRIEFSADDAPATPETVSTALAGQVSLENVVLWQMAYAEMQPGGRGEEVSEGELAEATGARLQGAAVSLDFFDALEVQPSLGRLFVAGDGAHGAALLVLNHELWSRRFAGEPDVIGSTVELGDQRLTVIGVMPEGFWFPGAAQFWLPFSRRQGLVAENSSAHVIGKLKNGVTVDQAQAELERLVVRNLGGDASGGRRPLRLLPLFED